MTSRSAILAPGGNSSVDVPVLIFARLAVRRRGGRAHPLAWDLAPSRDVTSQRQRVGRVAVDDWRPGAAPVVVGKSLGSLAAPLVADRGLAAVWFTPLLTDEPTVAALRRATGPCLLVGGTADPYWNGQTARSLTAGVVEINGADHAMVVSGRLTESAAA